MFITLASVALAAWPEDPSVTGMLEHQGVRVVDGAVLADDYAQLVSELGTVIANQPVMPASTTGTAGFEFAFTNTFVFTDAIEREREVSPWDRAVDSEDAESYLFVPGFSARKGLPLSTEIGGSVRWVGLTRTGAASAFGRIALIEGYKPWPDLTLQIGYSGYVGNDELELGVMDMGVTLGTRLETGSGGMNTGRFEPFANFSLLRVTAASTVDEATAAAVGAVSFRRKGEGLPPIAYSRVGAGFQVTSGNVHFRLAGSWAWKTLPTATAGMGLTF